MVWDKSRKRQRVSLPLPTTKSTIKNKIYELQNQAKGNNGVIQNIVNQVSGADEILKYKQLLDAGVLTQEEFDRKKQEILFGSR